MKSEIERLKELISVTQYLIDRRRGHRARGITTLSMRKAIIKYEKQLRELERK